MSSNKLSNMTRRFKRKKRGDSGDADTRTTEEIIKTLDLSTACSMLTDKVDRCPDGYGGSTTLSSIYETYFQNALRNDIPQSRRGEVKASIFTQTYIPAQPQWAQWSQRLDSKTEKVAIQIVAEHVFGEPEDLFASSYGASGDAAQNSRYGQRGPGGSSTKTVNDVAAQTWYESNQFGERPDPEEPSDHEYDNLRNELGEIILMSGARGGSGGDPSASPSSTDTLVKKFNRDEQRTTAMIKLNTLKSHPDPEISQYAHTVADSAAVMEGEDLSRAVEVIESLLDMSDQQHEDGDDAEGDEEGYYEDQGGADREEDDSDED